MSYDAETPWERLKREEHEAWLQREVASLSLRTSLARRLPTTVASAAEFARIFGPQPAPAEPEPLYPSTERGAPKAWSHQIQRAIDSRPR